MSTPVVVLLVVVAAAVLFALAWWWSGRSRGAEHNALAAVERGEAEFKTMSELPARRRHPVRAGRLGHVGDGRVEGGDQLGRVHGQRHSVARRRRG